MDAALTAAYQPRAPITATLIRIDMPAAAVCLTDGGFAIHDAGGGDGPEAYYGRHPIYGVLSSVSSIKDGAETQTTRIDLVLQPPSDVAVAALANPSTQGVRVQWWEGVVDPETGLLIGQPELKFDGEIDKPRFQVADDWSLTLECGTQAERQLEQNADWRLNDAFHRRIWPGEAGLSNVSRVTRKTEWRSRPESPGLFKRLMKAFVPISNL